MRRKLGLNQTDSIKTVEIDTPQPTGQQDKTEDIKLTEKVEPDEEMKEEESDSMP